MGYPRAIFTSTLKKRPTKRQKRPTKRQKRPTKRQKRPGAALPRAPSSPAHSSSQVPESALPGTYLTSQQDTHLRSQKIGPSAYASTYNTYTRVCEMLIRILRIIEYLYVVRYILETYKCKVRKNPLPAARGAFASTYILVIKVRRLYKYQA